MKKSEDTNRSNRAEEEELEQEYRELLAPHVEKWDQSITPPNPPALAALTALVGEKNKALRQRYWKELALFWIVSLMVLSVLLLLWQSSIILFAIVQGIAFVAAAVFMAVSGAKRRERRRREWQE
ncbi:hypothetical protein A8990_112121 [Paenibacillus taihuensis]|uniref:Uncharacterized protein n=1 Tax=Paenibacillus taihuensis TaxID=1156355 RepID=A0A3D9RZN0_9BACL|nr:DUF5345 family protein [Paenibacillus taihuensis]REE85392.1 hypothetical protein A8990_112121 [Paenibacillus taihuensis]